MDATKKLLKNIPEYLLYFLATDLICMLLAWVINIVARPVLLEMARDNAERLAIVENGFNLLFVGLFYVIFAVVLVKSSIQRNAYLSATIGKQYRFGADLAEFLRGDLLIGMAAYLIFCLPVTVLVYLFPDIQYVPTLFYPQDAMISLVGPWKALLFDLAIYTVFSIVLFPCLHFWWEKNRLYK